MNGSTFARPSRLTGAAIAEAIGQTIRPEKTPPTLRIDIPARVGERDVSILIDGPDAPPKTPAAEQETG